MAESEVEVFNKALSAATTRSFVSATTEESREAEVCRTWYPTVRDQVLRAAWWPSTKKWARLGLLAERNFSNDWVIDDPGPQWKFAYALPSDMIAPRHVSTYGRFTTELYSPASGNEVVALMTDEEDVILQYSKRQTNTKIWDASLDMAITFGLAAFITAPLTGKLELAQDNERKANDLIFRARENIANAQVEAYETVPDWIAARPYSDSPPRTRFLYPYGPALSISGELGPVTRAVTVI